MNKKNPFSTPKGYFDDLKDRLMDAVEAEETDFPADEGFAVPEGYFDSVGQNISKRMAGGDTKVIALRPYQNLLYAVSAAAAVVLLVFGLQYKPDVSPGFDTIASIEIIEYLSLESDELNSYDIGEELGLDDGVYNAVLDENLQDENIMDYLDESIDELDVLNFETDE